jgi:sugar/nucleoside kinase (ribokinase family)
VDHVGVDGALRAARLARAAGIPVVADLERDSGPGFAALFELVDHLIVSREFALSRTGTKVPEDAVGRLWDEHRDTVVVTDGENGAWYRSRDAADGTLHQPAYPIQVVDSTGCGDVFHGAYATSLAAGMKVGLRVRFAAIAAALKARRPGGQAGAPRLAEVSAVLDEWSP